MLSILSPVSLFRYENHICDVGSLLKCLYLFESRFKFLQLNFCKQNARDKFKKERGWIQGDIFCCVEYCTVIESRVYLVSFV